MTNKSRIEGSSPRDFLEVSATGAIGLSTGLLTSSAKAVETTMMYLRRQHSVT